MIKKTVSYEDYNGEKVTEDVYFNLEEAEITKFQFTEYGSLVNYIEYIQNERDTKKLIELLDELIVLAYGEKTPDGKHFMKSPDIAAKFRCSKAYNDIFMECVGDADKAVAFVAGILPKNIQAEAKANMEKEMAKIQELNNAEN